MRYARLSLAHEDHPPDVDGQSDFLVPLIWPEFARTVQHSALSYPAVVYAPYSVRRPILTSIRRLLTNLVVVPHTVFAHFDRMESNQLDEQSDAPENKENSRRKINA